MTDPVKQYLEKYGKPQQAAAPDPVQSYLAKYGGQPTPPAEDPIRQPIPFGVPDAAPSDATSVRAPDIPPARPQRTLRAAPAGPAALPVSPQDRERHRKTLSTPKRVGDEGYGIAETLKDAATGKGSFSPDTPVGMALDVTMIPGAVRAGAMTREALQADAPVAAGVIAASSILPGIPGLRRGAKAVGNAMTPPPAYLADPDVAAIRSTVGTGAGTLRPKFRGLQAAGRDIAERAYARVVDELYPLRKFGREVGGTERLSQEASRASGYRGAAEVRVRSELKPVLERAKGHEDGAVALAKAERIIELADNGKATDPAQLAAAQATVTKLSAVPEVRGAVDALRQYYRSLLDHKLANGVITKEQYDAIVAKGQAYVPMVVQEAAEQQVPTAGGGKLVNRGTGVRKMTDRLNLHTTVDPYEQAVLDTFEAERTVAKQRVTNLVAQIVESDPAGAGPYVRKLAGDAKATGREVAANIGGSRQRFDVVDDELAQAWGAFDNRTQNLFVRVLQPFKRTLQAGVTLLPDFAAANAMRDNVQSAIQYSYPVKTSLGGAVAGGAIGATVDDENRTRGLLTGAGLGLGAGGIAPNIARTARAAFDVIGKTDLYDEWLRQGGGGMSEFYAKPSDAAKVIARLRKEPGIAETIISPKRWFEVLQEIGRVAEESPRVARFRALKEAGADGAEAAAGARDVSLDFSNIGRDTKGIASVTAFFNAKIQGWDKLVRLLKNPKTHAIGAATITAPSIALWNLNKDNPEYWERPQWERNMFWLLPRGEGQGFWRIPKPFEIGFLYASVPERVLDFAYQQDPETLEHALGDMLKTTGEGTLPVPTALEPLIENTVNYDFFTNRPVVSRGLEQLPAELQHDDRTSSVAVGLGKLTGKSPQQIDNVLKGYTGSAGQLALRATDKLARATGLDDRPLDPTGRAPLVGRFLTRPDQTSDAEEAVRRRFAEAQEAYRGAVELAERGDKEALRAFVREHREQLLAYPVLKEQSAGLAELYDARRKILANPNLSDDDKRRLIARLSEVRNQVAGATRPNPALAAR